ncbi:IS21-like element helper ATPase IstB [Desulfothermobacter acidiphilus]|uniref:IS21-like element helper ATPase IstB n=1 Tax=Desulfothermobacter acidiphilus TaxID=1938353 RepID=UPI003F8BFF69
MNNASEALVDLYCKELRLPGLKRAYRDIAREALAQGRTPVDFLAACLAQELASRRESRIRARLTQARFPAPKTLDAFDFTLLPELPKAKVLHLAKGEFIKKKENVILLGNSGTGKTHVAIGLGIAAIAAGYRVRFIPVVDLAQELLQAEQEYCLPKYLKGWQKVDLVIADELGYINLGPGASLLFQFCAARYERGSMVITTNLEFSRWTEVFGDATLTGALLDRLTHHAHILLFKGESYRFRESQQRQSVNMDT